MQNLIKRLLSAVGLAMLPWALRRKKIIWSDNKERSLDRARAAEFSVFKSEYAHLVQGKPPVPLRNHAVVASVGIEGLYPTLVVINALRLAGYRVTFVLNRSWWLRKHLRLIEDVTVRFWDEFETDGDVLEFRPTDINHLKQFELRGVRAGRFAASTALRRLRTGSLDLSDPGIAEEAQTELRRAVQATEAAERILGEFNPDLVVLKDRGYTPNGQLFDLAIEAGIDVVTFNTAHRSDGLMFKRYRHGNRDEHPASLSRRSWDLLEKRPWGKEQRDRVHRELYECYGSGNWHSEIGTQFKSRVVDSRTLQQSVGFSGEKPIAAIFPHILWDGTFFWGDDLFETYEEWFVESIAAAIENDAVDWIVKIHPAHLIQNARDRYQGETTEEAAIRERFGKLPSHLRLLRPDTSLSTYSFYDLIDYCITVRGTVGIEAAVKGIPVLTAGTGRYDGRGFTIDSRDRDEYLAKLGELQKLSVPPEGQELAERFGYGVFVMRPLLLESVDLKFERDEVATARGRIRITDPDEWWSSRDVVALSEWLSNRDLEDFLAER